MFDAFLRRRADRDGRAVRAFDAGATTTATSTAGPGSTARAGSCLPGHRPARGLARRSRPAAPTVHGLSNQKNDWCCACSREGGVEVFDGSVRYVQAVRGTPACARPWSRPAPTPRRCSTPRGSPTCSTPASTASSPPSGTCAGKPAPDTFLAGAEALGVPARRGRGVRGRPRRGRGRPGRVASASWWASTGSGQARRAAAPRRRRGRRRPGRAAGADEDGHGYR